MKIYYFASVREMMGTGEEQIEIRGETTIGAFVKEHIAPRAGVGNSRIFLYAVNEEHAALETRITDKDVLAVLPPFSGC